MKKMTVGACIDMEIYRKVRMMHFVENVFFDNKNVTISSIIQEALKEYFENHDDEYKKMIDKYYENGGWLEL
jgi:hypothetical protein